MLVFLFTDLESSTRLWEEHPDEMKGALARHDEILREAVVAGNGTVVKTTGDGLMASTRLVELMRAQGRSPDGADDLLELYETFTEGFDEPGLVAARVALGLAGNSRMGR
jgi:class 3 adenylate cyclase